MEKITVTMENNSIDIAKGTPLINIINDLPVKNKQQLIALSNDNTLYDLLTPINEEEELVPVYIYESKALEVLRHSTSHVMAQAVKHLFPEVKLAIGPAIKNGFYYDFDFKEKLSSQDLGKIEQEMSKIINQDQAFQRFTMKKEEAIRFFEENQETYKVELIRGMGPKEEISLYQNGDFIDLCRGPHLPSTGFIKTFKLLSLAGAYWRGDERNPMLTRIYGTSFLNEKDLRVYLRRIEEAKKRDHRKLGKQLELFSIHEEAPGFPFWLPNGMVLRNCLLDFWRHEHRKAGYVEVKTPLLLKKDLWVTSGHWENYRENMYLTEIDDYPFAVKPMNCPGSMVVYKEKLHSYRDFPLRMAEVGLVHRHEKSGVLQGLFRVRSFTQDDAHIFMLPSQIEEEIIRVIELTERIYSVFGFDYQLELSTRPEKSIGTAEQWETATQGLENALLKVGKRYKVSQGEGAFYGPKIDFHLEDCLGRLHQCATIQLDMFLPERFDLTYMDQEGKPQRPVVIHRTVLGSIERFIGILIEHFGGRFPLWLAPVQVAVMPITDHHALKAKEVSHKVLQKGFRVILDDRNEKLGYKMREAELKKIPYIVVIGDKEIEQETVAIRKGGGSDMGSWQLSDFIDMLDQEEASRKIF